jgi:RNA polymerase sigma-70 factor (ECF subfamily)
MGGENSDFELLDRWGQGDLKAGSTLFERHFDSLYRFFRNKAQSGVEDLMQQTLLACVEGRPRFRREASFRTYMFQTARFQLHAHYRKLRRDTQLDFSLITAEELGTSPSGAVSRRQDARLLLEAMRRIPVDFQLVLELSFWEGLSGVEIAEILGIPEPTVRSRMRRGTERLREQMQQLEDAAVGLHDTAEDLDAWAARVRTLVQEER